MDLFSAKIADASVDSFLTNVNREIINPLIIFLFALALVFFLYGMLEFILNGASDEKRTTGKSHMIWGIVGITIMMGVWAILGVLTRTMEIDGQVKPEEGTVDLSEYNPTFPPR